MQALHENRKLNLLDAFWIKNKVITFYCLKMIEIK